MELQQRSLIKICLIGFLMCFALIYYIDHSFELKTISLDSIFIKDIDKYVKIDGKLTKSNVLNNNVFFEIKNNNTSIKGIMFNNNISLEKNNNYSIEGKISSYKGELEIIAQKIEKTQ